MRDYLATANGLDIDLSRPDAVYAADNVAIAQAVTIALGTFKGTGEAVANSTAGQFRNLENDFHEVWKSLGDELLPTMSKPPGASIS